MSEGSEKEPIFSPEWKPVLDERVQLRKDLGFKRPGLEQHGLRLALQLTNNGNLLQESKTYRIVKIEEEKIFVREEENPTNIQSIHIAGMTHKPAALIGPEIGPLGASFYEKKF